LLKALQKNLSFEKEKKIVNIESVQLYLNLRFLKLTSEKGDRSKVASFPKGYCE